MTKIEEILMHPSSAAVIRDGPYSMFYSQSDEEWQVIKNPPGARKYTLLYSGDKAGAVAAFAQATGLEEKL